MDRENYISDEQVIKRANAAVKFAIEKKKITNSPIVVYDRKSGVVYSVNSDGSRTTLAARTTKGRYSERYSKN